VAGQIEHDEIGDRAGCEQPARTGSPSVAAALRVAATIASATVRPSSEQASATITGIEGMCEVPG
jgi:hypothetical protein